MRVVFANLHWAAEWSTVADFAASDRVRPALARALAARGHEIHIVQAAPFDGSVQLHPQINASFIRPEARVRALRSAAARVGRPFPAAHGVCRRWLAAIRASLTTGAGVLHGFDPGAFSSVAALGREAALVNVPLVLHFHGGQPPATTVGLRQARSALSGVATVGFTHRSLAAPYLAAGVLSAAQVEEVLELSSEFTFRPQRMPGLSGAPVVLSLARLDPVKDPLTTIDGFTSFLGAHPGSHLHLAYAAAPLLSHVRRRVRALGVESAVTFHGVVNHARVPELLSSADILVQASVREVCGTAVVEALATGCLPVVTDIPAFHAVLGDALAPFRFPVGEPEALAAALHRASGVHPSRTLARSRFDEACSWSVLAARWEELYLAAARRSTSPP